MDYDAVGQELYDMRISLRNLGNRIEQEISELEARENLQENLDKIEDLQKAARAVTFANRELWNGIPVGIR